MVIINRKKQWKQIGCVMVLSALCSFIAFSLNGLGLLGDYSIRFADMDTQYIPFYTMLKEGRMDPYSFEVGLGMNTIGIFAYYCSSPLTLLLRLWPTDALPDGVLCLAIFRMALSGGAFAWMLTQLYGTDGKGVVPFSLAYSQMSYFYFFFINQYWFTGMLWLPILFVGVQQIIKGDRPLWMVLPLAILFWSNFYISYIVGLFLALVVLAFSLTEPRPLQTALRKVGRLAGYAINGFLISGALLVPTLYSFATTPSNHFDAYKPINYTFKQFFRKWFVGAFDSIGNECAPTVFCGLLIALFAVMYFFNKSVSTREKAVYGGLLGFLFVCTIFPFTDRIWHGFAYPNSFAYRYAFLISFLMVWLSWQAFQLYSHFSTQWVLVPVLILALFGTFHTKVLNNVEPASYWATMIALLLVVLLLFLLSKKGKTTLLTACVLCFVMVEATVNGALILRGVGVQNTYPLKSQIEERKQVLLQTLPEVEEGYRVAIVSDQMRNDGAEFGFSSLSTFTSSMNEEMVQLLGKMGYEPSFKGYSYGQGHFLSDALLGVQTILEEPFSDKNIMDNPMALPLGILLPDGFHRWDPMEKENFAEGFFRENAAIKDVSPVTHYGEMELETFSNTEITGTITVPEGTYDLFLNIPYDEGWQLEVDGQKTPLDRAMGQFMSVSLAEGNHTIHLKYQLPYGTLGWLVSALGIYLFGAQWTRKKEGTE